MLGAGLQLGPDEFGGGAAPGRITHVLDEDRAAARTTDAGVRGVFWRYTANTAAGFVVYGDASGGQCADHWLFGLQEWFGDYFARTVTGR